MKSKFSNEAFRAAAKAIVGEHATVSQWGSVERPHSGGAYVEVLIFVSDGEASEHEERLQAEGGPRWAEEMAKP